MNGGYAFEAIVWRHRECNDGKHPMTRMGAVRVEAGGASIAVLRRCLLYFLAPQDHEDDQRRGGYQCHCGKYASWIVQNK